MAIYWGLAPCLFGRRTGETAPGNQATRQPPAATNKEGEVMQEKCVYIVDADSGWENDEDIMWHIDEGNAADWADGVVMHLDAP